MTRVLDAAEDAARLISFGLRPTHRPSTDADYAQLLGRYRGESSFREHVHVIARGLGLVVLGETELGIVLGAEEAGPFAQRLSDYRRNLSVEDRMCHGLIQLTIAAWCFPTAESLEDPDAVAGSRISVNRTVDYLVGVCEELKTKSEQDPDAGSPELHEAWRTVLKRAQTRGTTDGRRTAGTLAGMVAHALEVLAEGGLLRKIDDSGGGTWQALSTYRLHVRELAAHEIALMVRDAASACAGGN